MKNTFLKDKTRADIDSLIGKILRDLGYPDPPVRTEEVIDLLKLDKQYYSIHEDGFLREAAHKIVVAGKQIWKRPGLLVDAVRQCSLKALYLPDRKRILIDKELPSIKQRWAEAHEVIHSITPWHGVLMHGDTKQTLNPSCHQAIEAEANYGAGRLLFLQDRFLEFLDPSRISIENLKLIARDFGNSITSTLWRAVESLDVPAVALISGHPHHPPADFDPINPCDYMVCSRKFADQFGTISELSLFHQIGAYCRHVKRGPLGASQLILSDASTRQHIFDFETFHNGYQALTLGIYNCPRAVLVRVG